MSCGCALLDNGGNPATWADAALTLAQTEIRENGWENNREALMSELALSNHFNVGPPTMQDDEISRTFSMDLLSPYIEAPEFKETHSDSTKQFQTERCYSSNEVAAIISSDDHTACSPRAVTMLASGSEEYRGKTQYIVVEDAVQCIDKYRGKTRGLFPRYLRELVRALPRAAMRIREWNIFNTLIANGWNTAETGDLGLSYSLGSIPQIPDAVFTASTALLFEQHLRGNDFSGRKVWHMHERVLRSYLLHRQFNGAAGFQIQATTFMGPQMPDYSVGSELKVDGISIMVTDLPFGYIKQTGPLLHEFIPIDRRQWKAVNRGVRAYGDSRYEGSSFTDDNGVKHALVSPIWAADPTAYLMRPFGIEASTPVTSGAEAWSLTSQVQFIGDAFLPCNEDRNKFKPRLKQAWKMDPQQPQAAACMWSRLPSYERIANRIGLDDFDYAPLVPVTLNPGCEVDGLTCAEKILCAPERASLPLSVGVLKTECRVEVADGTTLLKICVLREVPVGYAADGIVTLDWATAPGTATAGTGNEYTTETGTLTWADGECGPKCFDVAILATATAGTSFTVDYSNVTPAPSAAVLIPATTCTSTTVSFPAAPVES